MDLETQCWTDALRIFTVYLFENCRFPRIIEPTRR